MTGVVTRGAVVATVLATGTLQPVDTVEVGSQVTGLVQTLGADFNSRVTAGQVLATLDPAALQAQVDQALATVSRLAAEVNRAKVTLADAEAKLRRADASEAAIGSSPTPTSTPHGPRASGLRRRSSPRRRRSSRLKAFARPGSRQPWPHDHSRAVGGYSAVEKR